MARGRKPLGKQALTAAQRQRRHRALSQIATRVYSEDPRREKPLSIVWNGDVIGRISIEGEYWAAVEWSTKLQCWCIEDSTGACLTHQEALQGAAASKEAAVALATEMIRDRRMPSPQEARARRRARLPEAERAALEAGEADDERRRLAAEKRAQQPSTQRRRAEAQQRRAELSRAWAAESQAKRREDHEQPLHETLSEVFDFADPELWKSNSFAALRPRLIIHLEAVIAKLNAERAFAQKQRRGRDRVWREREIAALMPRLAKAREILELLQEP
jgi:hypothetical protein